jgi:hypothetical protein
MLCAVGRWHELDLRKDRMLPSVRNRFVSAYQHARIPIPRPAYIRVWNLFYLCDATLNSALRAIKGISNPPVCATESKAPPIIWFAWGGDDPRLNSFKQRFSSLPAKQVFFYDWEEAAIVSRLPAETEFAKHPQGLASQPIVTHISKVLKGLVLEL